MSKKKNPEVPEPIEPGADLQVDAEPKDSAISQPELASLMQVREILTGPLASEVEQRIVEMDRRIDRVLQDLAQSTTKRIDAVENNYRDETRRLNDDLKAERDQQQQRIETLERETSLGQEQMREEIQKVREEVTKSTERMHEELTREYEAIHRKIEELLQKVDERFADERQSLRTELVDRDSLSAALSEVAIRLAGPGDAGHHVDPTQPDIEIDQILDGATSGNP
jgi:DNA anti-recombination protein RmuC